MVGIKNGCVFVLLFKMEVVLIFMCFWTLIHCTVNLKHSLPSNALKLVPLLVRDPRDGGGEPLACIRTSGRV